MNAAQKAEALLALQFAQNALAEVLVRAGSDRPRDVSENVHSAVESLEKASRTLRLLKVTEVSRG